MARRSEPKGETGFKQKTKESKIIESEKEDAKSAERPKKEYEIDIFKGWCKACGICSAFCPRECIGRDEEGVPFIIDASRCTGCGWCEVHCPDFAISVRSRSARNIRPEEE